MPPRMIVVAGPPGGGKSTIFPVASFGVDSFNADDRAAELNGGSYAGISSLVRRTVNLEFDAFVLSSIEERVSFAIETTLRTDVTFDQARLAKAAGFTTEMRYVALHDFALHLERVMARADAGGHSASEATLRRIHKLSLANLRRAIAEMDDLWAYDNSLVGGPPQRVMQSEQGVIRFLTDTPPEWLITALDTRAGAGIED